MSSNSTDHGVRAFWDAHLLPAAEALRARGVDFLTPFEAESTFAPVAGGPDLFTVERAELAARLTAQWAEHPELAALVEPLVALVEARLAAQAAAEAEDAGDVSPFMYVMF